MHRKTSNVERIPPAGSWTRAARLMVLMLGLASIAHGSDIVMVAERLDIQDQDYVLDQVKLSFVAPIDGRILNPFDLVVVVGEEMLEPAECEEGICFNVEQQVIEPLVFEESEIIEKDEIWVNVPPVPTIWKHWVLGQGVPVGAGKSVFIGLRADLEALDPNGFLLKTRIVEEADDASWISGDGGTTWHRFTPYRLGALTAPEGTTYIQIEVHPPD